MKSIHVTFEDNEHKRLKDKKGRQSWHDFITQMGRVNE